MENRFISLLNCLPDVAFYIPDEHLSWIDLDKVQTLGLPCRNRQDKAVLEKGLAENVVEMIRDTLATGEGSEFITTQTHIKLAWLEASRRLSFLDSLRSREDLIESTLLLVNELESVDVSELIYEQTDLLYKLMPKVDIQRLTERVMTIYIDVQKLMSDTDMILGSPAVGEALLYQVGLLDVDIVEFINKLIIHLVFNQYQP